MRLHIPLLGGVAILATTLAPNTGRASSHREAPFISKLPALDGTDFYMFNSYETGRAGYVTILANYIPLEDAYGGPNYFSLDPDALYEIHVDNNGDGVEDLTFQFQFSSSLANSGNGFAIDVGPAGNTKSIAIPVVVGGPGITDHDNEIPRNQIDSFKVNVVTGPRRTGAVAAITNHAGGATTFTKPIDNIGSKTIVDYATYANSFIYQVDIPGCTPPAGTFPKVFVGQRQEGFPVNLGQVFDLVNFALDNTHQPLANVIGTEDQGKNIVSDKNVTTIALEIPASCLVASGKTNIGAWTTSSVRQARVINPTPTFTDPSRVGGPWVQVSRVGMPLVNEVVIGLKDKNKFNSSEPKDDAANFADYVTNPALPEILETLFGSVAPVVAPNRFPRGDLLSAFALGVMGVNDVGTTPAEMLRLNTTIAAPFAPRTADAQNPLGAALCFNNATMTDDAHLDAAATGCDPTGFPNGRRPGDDTTDIELRVAMGFLINRTDAPSGSIPFVDGATSGPVVNPGDPGGNPVHTMAQNFGIKFPYLNTPIAGSPGGS